MNHQGGLRFRRLFAHSTLVVSGFPKRPHLPESEKNLPQNAASAAMVQVGGRQKELGKAWKHKNVEVQRLGRISYGKREIVVLSTASER